MKTDKTIQTLLKKPTTALEKFHSKTTIYAKKHYQNNVFHNDLIFYKSYARLPLIELPQPHHKSIHKLENGLLHRRSQRSVNKKIITLDYLSNLLYFSFGISDKTSMYRFYPSAGACFPLEMYLLSLNTKLKKGLYHYYVKEHSLEVLKQIQKLNLDKYFDQEWITQAKLIIIFTAVFKRSSRRYGDRSYRFALLEAGHAAQNIYLLSSAIGMNCCAIGGFYDKTLAQLLDIDGITEAPIYALALS